MPVLIPSLYIPVILVDPVLVAILPSSDLSIAMTNKKSKHKDITRIDQESPKTYSWRVRIRFLGKIHSKYISDKKLGGRDRSLLAAIAWRDATEKRLGKPRTDRHIVTQTKNASGVVGVRLNEKMGRYEVSWVDKSGKPGKTALSVRKHGKAKAFKLAYKIRAQKDVERLATV